MLRGVALTFALAHSGDAAAEVVDVAPNGMSLRETAHIAAAPDKVYAALVTPSQWWSSDHSFSGNAANFTFDVRAGGCWCETLPNGGSAEHLIVVNAAPGNCSVMRGAPGPLQGLAVDGALTWSLKPAGDGTDLSVTYNVDGSSEGRPRRSWAMPTRWRARRRAVLPPEIADRNRLARH